MDIDKREALLVAGLYEERRRAYHHARGAILGSTGGSFQGKAHNSGKWSGNRTTETKAAKLESLERLPWVKEMHAVEHARDRIGASLPDEMREALKKAIMLNCVSGRKYPFERLYTVGISRRGFYRYRQAFLADLGEKLNQIHQNNKERGTDAATNERSRKTC